eukprot:SAG31_NODE_1730_length_7424_cov_28.201911_4_plen_125_part_00
MPLSATDPQLPPAVPSGGERSVPGLLTLLAAGALRCRPRGRAGPRATASTAAASHKGQGRRLGLGPTVVHVAVDLPDHVLQQLSEYVPVLKYPLRTGTGTYLPRLLSLSSRFNLANSTSITELY